MSVEPRYPLSVNTGIVNKPDKGAPVDFARGWDPIESTLEELTECVKSGYAIAGQYRNGYRKTQNFIQAGFLAADVDDGLTLETALDHPFVRRHASLLHTTASHTTLRHRYHVFFLLDQAIRDAREFAAAQYGLALTLGTDPSVADGARMFFSNSAAIFHGIGKTMDPEVVSDLVARGRDARASTSSPGHRRLPVDSSRKMGPGALVRLAAGDDVRMDELRPGASVHCPYHDDEHPSAFVVRSERGAVGVHCSVCKVTFWPNNDRDEYDFDAFDKLFEQRAVAEQHAEQETEGFARFFPPKPRFVKLQRQFLPPIGYAPGITLVKSPKGSGKTEALVSMVKEIKAQDFPSSLQRRDRPKSILLIGHRRTLIREATAKLGLRCYIGSDDDDSGSLTTLGVCLDSLPKYGESFGAGKNQRAWYRKGPFDLVIIDEVEQVLKHLLSETIENGAGLERCFDALQHEIAHAKAVYALDADLGLLTVQAMRLMRPRDWESDCRIFLNAPAPSAQRIMRLFADRKALIVELIDAVRQGQRIFVTSNSKENILDIEKMIRTEFDDRIVMRVVTGYNSQDEATIEFVKNIRTEF